MTFFSKINDVTNVSAYSKLIQEYTSFTTKLKSSFRHFKQGIQDFHMNYVLVPADKAANNVVVV